MILMKDRFDEGFANRVEDIASELAPEPTRPMFRQIDFLKKRVDGLTTDDGPSKLQEAVHGLADDIMNARSGGIKDVPRAIAGAIAHHPAVLQGLEPTQIRFMLSSALGMYADLEEKSRKTSEKGASLGNPKLKDEFERWAGIHTRRAADARALIGRLREPISPSSPSQRV